jgi:hypothetical protein
VPCLEALGKEINFFLKKLFAKCPDWRHSAKKLTFLKKLFAECSAWRHSARKLFF